MAATFQSLLLPSLVRCPARLLSDNGPEFVCWSFNEVLREYGIEHVYSTPYKPSSNGAVERCNRTLAELLRSLVADSMEWDLKLGKAVMVYNSSLHSQTGLSPSNCILRDSHFVKAQPLVSTGRREVWSEGHPGFHPFSLGQFVLKKVQFHGHATINKLKPRYEGPYRVTKVNDNKVTYQLQHGTNSKMVKAHHRQLKPWQSPPRYLQPYFDHFHGGDFEADVSEGPSSDSSVGGLPFWSLDVDSVSTGSSDESKSSSDDENSSRSAEVLREEIGKEELETDISWVRLLSQMKSLPRLLPGVPISSTPENHPPPESRVSWCLTPVVNPCDSVATHWQPVIANLTELSDEQHNVIVQQDAVLEAAGMALDHVQDWISGSPTFGDRSSSTVSGKFEEPAPIEQHCKTFEFSGFEDEPERVNCPQILHLTGRQDRFSPLMQMLARAKADIEENRRRSQSRLTNLYLSSRIGLSGLGGDSASGTPIQDSAAPTHHYLTRSRGPVRDLPWVPTTPLERKRPLDCRGDRGE